MKQTNQSKLASRSSHNSSSTGERNQDVRFRDLFRTRLIKIVLTAIFIASLIVIYVLANKSNINNNTEPIQPPISANQVTEVEVVDGVGNARIAQHVTDILRALGYDVVELKKSNEGVVERSYVLDRSGNIDLARKLAMSLGIPKDKVFQKIDHNLYLDATVVVGKDYSKLKVFQSFIKRNKR